ncbi:NADH:ubiquinone reductase (Na(+)-transporting) subunit C [Arcticibacterium luteifluviistationis]|uniref:Na(+)-translocating NADH-quinone reductase subunit C n=1 Tax=Arcticibacterium luteifluviistationis TaxID=1784714 RepID=A0A2Z4G9L3_9BACT|nr:NADH:ubiquinone reductase (Na(+)-transporting) subunit C [Arcticibacterium luteifluviistationis]AWV97770.1 NADH:ubiquinone reductase (Na(+)-transporting) subunit C [Arcticibacterium luteifluviistationis]
MHSNKYTFIYAIGLSMLTAVILVLTSQQLKPLQEANLALDGKRSVLKSVLVTSDEDKVIEDSYNGSVEEIVLDSEGNVLEVQVEDVDMKREVAKDVSERQLPLYVYTEEDGSKSYIVPMRGVGLWGPVWGYMALEGDFNTIKGASFDHKGETPGLGAEITEPFFQVQFQGKKILDDNGDFASVNVLKSTMKSSIDSDNRVDAISGGTITSNGVDDMIKNCVAPYLTYFNKLKTN